MSTRDFRPGVYPGIDPVEYHDQIFGPAGGSVSSTDAKNLLVAPAYYQYHHGHHPAPSRAMELGTAIHAAVLGVGQADMATIEGSWRTKAAREAVAAAREAGQIPLSPDEAWEVQSIAAAVRDQSAAAGLLDGPGIAEASIYAPDTATGVWMRGRPDWIAGDLTSDEPVVMVDLKTTSGDASPDSFAREAARWDYPLQAAWYRKIWHQIHGYTPRFVHVVVSKTPPYLVGVYELDDEYLTAGLVRARRALNRYTECVRAASWPGHSPDIELLGAPAWYTADAGLEVY
ncbi:PD-(D/E)XK nuclease-like domain-containing protein [Actinobaculum sp. 352]|uniref:PD-(D/E)XK nuclease-like domain-containing protein n=1 Tax=Actinobaculum sp. 352 TaxID=2490946 RepID=UPI000F7DB32D|nr:PD-(D/E)XK nuclease-like domain-containing protein [Actinobaculum sp. 352]RTE49346.1 hypothetical protein EKN07_07200 [Actinobaculum sp. 352]